MRDAARVLWVECVGDGIRRFGKKAVASDEWPVAGTPLEIVEFSCRIGRPAVRSAAGMRGNWVTRRKLGITIDGSGITNHQSRITGHQNV